MTRWALPLVAAAMLVSGCKLLGIGDKDDEKASDAGTGSAPGTGSPVASGSNEPGVGSTSSVATSSMREVTYALDVSVQAGAAPKQATYESVRDVFTNRCVQCHAPGHAFDLSRWPIKGRFATPQDAVKEVLARVADQAKPMPPAPAAALTAAETQLLKDWLDAGLKEKPEVVTAPFADTVTIRIKARPSHAAVDVDTTFPWNGSGAFTGSLRLPLYDVATVRVSAHGEDGAELDGKTYENLAVGPEGDFRFALAITDAAIRKHVVDIEAPKVGAEGVVTASAIEETSLQLDWTRAGDQLTAQDALTYAVYVADDDTAFATVDQVLAKGRKAMDFSKNLAGSKISGLARGRAYFFAVLVKDEAGNQSLYKVLKQATATDRILPTVPTPALRTSNATEAKVTLAWTPAADNASKPEAMVYRVFFSPTDNIKTVEDAEQKGVLVGTTKPGVAFLNVKGLMPETVYYLNVLARDEGGNQAAYKTLRLLSKTPVGAMDVVAHGKQCAERVGTIKPFSCFDGQIMPIKVGQQEIGPNLTPEQAAQYGFGTSEATQQKCDKPALLGLGAQGHCIPYGRVGRLKTYRKDGTEHPDVDAVFTCRRYTAQLGKVRWKGQDYDGADYPGFEDIAVIMHNRVSGETCFFQMLEPNYAQKDGRRIPPPTEEALPEGSPAHAVAARAFWLGPDATAAKNCNRCHDSDPWMHSPYIDQVRHTDGTPIVPSGAFGGGRTGKYSVVGSRGFYKWAKSLAVSSTQTADTNGKSCTSCHNVGNFGGCGSWSALSAGLALAPNSSAFGQTDYLHRFWMPPSESGISNEADWQASGYKKAAEHLLACCETPTATGCTTTPIMTPPPPYEQD